MDTSTSVVLAAPPPITSHNFECTAAHILRTAALACAQSNGSKPCDRAGCAAELAVSIASLPYLNKPNAHVRSAGYDYRAQDGVVAETCGAERGTLFMRPVCTAICVEIPVHVTHKLGNRFLVSSALQVPVVTLSSTKFTTRKPTFYLACIPVLMWLSEHAAITSLHSLKGRVFITEAVFTMRYDLNI